MLATLLEILIPTHLAIIMDGNRRGGKQLFGEEMKGHELGAKVVELVIRLCLKYRIMFLTLYAFSTENWTRKPEEIRWLFDLFRCFFSEKQDEIHDAGVRVRFIGRRDRIAPDIRVMMSAIEMKTAKNTKLVLTIAIDYGGQDEIVRACKRLFWKVCTFRINPFTISKEDFAGCLDTHDVPEPSLLLRTGGEKRISNFLLWQCAYSEFVFLSKYWCTLTEEDFVAALKEYSGRKRRLGGDDTNTTT